MLKKTNHKGHDEFTQSSQIQNFNFVCFVNFRGAPCG